MWRWSSATSPDRHETKNQDAVGADPFRRRADRVRPPHPVGPDGGREPQSCRQVSGRLAADRPGQTLSNFAMKTLLQSFRLLLVFTLLTGLLYPLAVWAAGRFFFRAAAEGSLLSRDGHVIGSALLAQKTADPRYFAPRPSAGD